MDTKLMMPILSQSTIHLAQEPSVFVIKSLQDVVNSYTDFRSVYGSLQISINVTPLLTCVKRLWKSNIDMVLSFAPNTSL